LIGLPLETKLRYGQPAKALENLSDQSKKRPNAKKADGSLHPPLGFLAAALGLPEKTSAAFAA
jgi:hypothetical protein